MITLLFGEMVIKAVLFFAAVGVIVTLWVGYRLTVALMDLYDWWERGHNPFGLSIDECIRNRIAAGTLAPDGKRWTAATLKAKEAKQAALKAQYLTYKGNLWEIVPPLPTDLILRLEAERLQA